MIIIISYITSVYRLVYNCGSTCLCVCEYGSNDCQVGGLSDLISWNVSVQDSQNLGNLTHQMICFTNPCGKEQLGTVWKLSVTFYHSGRAVPAMATSMLASLGSSHWLQAKNHFLLLSHPRPFATASVSSKDADWSNVFWPATSVKL